MTMLNEEIVKELAKYDDMFQGFSYNDIIQEKNDDEDDKEEETTHTEEMVEGKPHPGEVAEESSSDSEENMERHADRVKDELMGVKQPRKKSTLSGASGTKSERKQSTAQDSSPLDGTHPEKTVTPQILTETTSEPTKEDIPKVESPQPPGEVKPEEKDAQQEQA